MQGWSMLLLLISPHVVAAAGCPRGWHGWRESCYIPLAESLSWLEASEDCERLRGDLMVQNSLEEHEFIMALRDKSFSQHSIKPLWLGCVFNQTVKCLDDERGEKGPFTDWHWNFADMAGRGCLYKGGLHKGLLKYGDCDETKFVICEMPSLVPVYCASLGADGRVLSPCLHGRVIKNLTVDGVSECGQACWAEPRCRSFNLWQGGPAKTCQLNDATRLEVSPRDITQWSGCFYFDL